MGSSGSRTLVSCAGTWTAKLLGLAPSVVCNQQGSVVLNQELLDVVLAMLVDKLLEIGNNRLCDGLADGIDLRRVSSSSDADADVDVGEVLEPDDQERLIHLEAQDFWLDEVQRLAVDL